MGAIIQVIAARVAWPEGVRGFIDRVAERPWAALIELLLIGGVVYTVLRFLQGTRGARLVRAILAILAGSFVIVWLIADRLELDRINALYPYFVLGVFLVSLVVFQAELRRILAHVGEGTIFQRWMKSSQQLIDPVVTAVDRLAKRKTGALIAIERRTEMAVWAESGIRMDAVTSAELLESVFQPNSPLHDLGVIIKGARIVAASCQFPLAESGAVDRSLGSRHRAAVGMSQESDAVVIAVSEETGAISMAVGGRMRRGLTTAALRDALFAEMRIEPASGKPPSGSSFPARERRRRPDGASQIA